MRNIKTAAKAARPCYRDTLLDAVRVFVDPAHFPSAPWDAKTRWTPWKLIWAGVLLAAWNPGSTLRDRFEAARDVLNECFPARQAVGDTYPGLIKALLTRSPLESLGQELRRKMRELAGPHWTRCGWCVFAADGSRVECPRTAANQEKFGCAGKAGCLPQMWITLLMHLGTGLPWAWKTGPGTDSERRPR